MLKIAYLEGDALRARLRRPAFAHEWAEYPLTRPGQVLERLRETDVAVINKVVLRAQTLAQLPRLKLIAIAATGANNVDLDWCRAHGLPVCNIRGYARTTVPEHVLMLMLTLRRQLFAYRADVQAGRWQAAENFCFFDHPVRDLCGATLGLIGRGSLGEGVARLAQAFGMTVLWGERKGAQSVRAGYVTFSELLAQSDVISLHCPLTEATQNLIGAAELAAMKPGALLINTARGGLVDEAALADALRTGRIGAGFDVLSAEPPVNGNPLLADDLLKQPNFVLTPHVAWASGQAMQALADQLIDNIEAWARGETVNRVA